MNIPDTSPQIDLTPFKDVLEYINLCFSNKCFSSGNMTFNIDGIIYKIKVSCNRLDSIDLQFNSCDIFSFFSQVLEFFSQQGRVVFKYGSTDRYKMYVSISTNQELELIKQSFSDLAVEALRKK